MGREGELRGLGVRAQEWLISIPLTFPFALPCSATRYGAWKCSARYRHGSVLPLVLALTAATPHACYQVKSIPRAVGRAEVRHHAIHHWSLVTCASQASYVVELRELTWALENGEGAKN